MAFPAIISNGTFTTAIANNITASLPGSRANGNVLIAEVRRTGSATDSIALDAGSSSWTIGIIAGQAGPRTAAIAWRVVDGTEAAPKFNFTNVDTIQAQVTQYGTAIYTAAPFGASVSNAGGSVSSITCPAIATTAANSLVINVCCNSNSTAPPAPSGWNSDLTTSSGAGFGSVEWASLQEATAGTSSGATSVSNTTTTYTVFTFEIRSQSPGTAYSNSIAESMSLADSPAATVATTASVAESMSLADSPSAATTFAVSVAESLSLADASSPAGTLIASISEAMSLADAPSAAGSLHDSVAEAISLADNVGGTILPYKGSIFTGVIGEVKINRRGLATIEVRGLLTLGRGVITERYGPMCRNDLGDDAGTSGSGGTCMIPILPADVQRSTAYILAAGATRINQAYVRARTASAGNPSDYANVYYECTTAGTTASSAPSYDPVVGHTTVDGGATFTTRNAWLRYAQVGTVIDDFTFTVLTLPDIRALDGWFALGEGIVRSGPRSGFPFHMKSWTHVGGIAVCFNVISDLLASGYWIELSAGCDKRPVTCNGTFSNIANYRGEDFTPGRDLPLTQN